MLEHLLGRPVDSFAYPHGSFDTAVRQLVIDAGFRSAAAIRNTLGPAGDDWFALGWVTVTADFDLERLTEVVTAPSALVHRSQRRLGDQLWRQAQRSQPWQSDRKVGG